MTKATSENVVSNTSPQLLPAMRASFLFLRSWGVQFIYFTYSHTLPIPSIPTLTIPTPFLRHTYSIPTKTNPYLPYTKPTLRYAFASCNLKLGLDRAWQSHLSSRCRSMESLLFLCYPVLQSKNLLNPPFYSLLL